MRRANLNTDGQCPTDIQGLVNEYSSIFPSGNRNAASFKWFSYIANCSASVKKTAFELMGTGFCPISGSPIGGTNKGQVTLNKIGGGTQTGVFYFCCDPCLCDMMDLVKVDTKTVSFGDEGSKEYNVLVHGDPCTNQAKLQESFTDPLTGKTQTLAEVAPEIACDGNVLRGATMSDGGKPIIGLLYDVDSSGILDGRTDAFKQGCAARASDGFSSGMGMIFRKVASITPTTL